MRNNAMRCTGWRPLRASSKEELRKAALPRAIEEQKRLCFKRIDGDEPCNIDDPSYVLCPGCASFKKRHSIPERSEFLDSYDYVRGE